METTPAAERLAALYRDWQGQPPTAIDALPKAGSDRQYFRLHGAGGSTIGVVSADLVENRAFLGFSRSFHDLGLPVPAIHAVAADTQSYLQQDLGDTSLLQFLEAGRKATGQLTEATIGLYEQVLTDLARLQVVGGKAIDYRLCFPRTDFDLQSIRWDLNYFKYYFLRAIKVPHDEQALEEDFETLGKWLLSTDCSHFMYRDCQARNIMVQDGKPWFIDYQGGRRGAPQYDVASLLYQAKADLPPAVREALLDHYIAALAQHTPVDPQAWKAHYRGYVLIRTLQVLGSYGFRGFFERRPHFLDSIPYAVDNLRELTAQDGWPVQLPALWAALRAVPEAEALQSLSRPEASKVLTVRVRSFSYKAGLPADPTENGGGFVFDCRAVPNPGRLDAYKPLTGRDKPVIAYLEAQQDTHSFFAEASALVEASVRRYLARGFTDLMVNFGCTGGQHRSVYFAERLARELGSRFPVTIDLLHVEQEKKGWVNG